MAKTVKVDVSNEDYLAGLRTLLKDILNLDGIDAVLAPAFLPGSEVLKPSLISNPDLVDSIDPLTPAFTLNAAKLVSRLTRKPSGGKIVALIRPCEIRAFIELVKLKQGGVDDLVLMGVDCLGAYSNADYAVFADGDVAKASKSFVDQAISGKTAKTEGIELSTACRVCDQPIPEAADIAVQLYGIDVKKELVVKAATEKGSVLLDLLGLTETDEPVSREKAVSDLITRRQSTYEAVRNETMEAINSTLKMNEYLSKCVNCYNCRVACPVCYCRECVFLTDVFDHEPIQYLKWTERKGEVRMPADTVFFHMTRITHMSLSCVGCGQCSNACPNDIPLTEVFRSLSEATQKSFEYKAGRDLKEAIPLSEFKEDEYQDVVGIHA